MHMLTPLIEAFSSKVNVFHIIASDDFPVEIKHHFHTDHEVLLYHNRCTCPMLNFSYVLRACSLKLDHYRHNSHYLLAWWVSSRH